MKNKETDKRRLNNFKTEKSKNLKRGKMKNWRGANWKTKIGKSKVENTWGAPGGRRPSPADRNLYFRKKSVFLGAWAASALRTGCNGSAPANKFPDLPVGTSGIFWKSKLRTLDAPAARTRRGARGSKSSPPRPARPGPKKLPSFRGPKRSSFGKQIGRRCAVGARSPREPVDK